MRLCLLSTLLFGLFALAGCGESTPQTVDPTKLAPPTAEQKASIQEFDAKIDDEEFGDPMPGSKGLRKAPKKK
jgi:predicted small lipoprotein YifL